MKKNYTIGIDIGGTKIMAGLVSPSGKIIRTDRRLTEANAGKATIMKNIFSSIGALIGDDVAAIGVGIAGSVDTKKGIYRQGTNFPRSFKNIPLTKLIHQEFGVPVIIDNDVHCFALGEAMYGGGKGKDMVVCLTLGTGIGGGIVYNGVLLRGKDNTAGELGHITIRSDKSALCSCGKKGHLEAASSGKAIARLFTTASKKKLESFWDVEDLVKKGDRHALYAVDTAVKDLGSGIASLLHILNPDVVVIGGGTAKIRRIWQKIRSAVKKDLAYPHLIHTPIIESKLGDDANVLGAAFLAKNR